MNVKSFLRVRAKFFYVTQVFGRPRAHPGSIHAKPGKVKNYLGKARDKVCKKRAPIIVQFRSDCQVLFAQLVKINRLTSLCG